MTLHNKVYLAVWLVIIPVMIAGASHYFTNPKTPVYRAKTVYTIVPKNALPTENYQDMQATNLFIDVIKSWLYSDNLQAEITEKLSSAKLESWRPLSMQTFEVAIISSDQANAVVGANAVREIVYREVGRYSQTNSEGYLIYNFSPTVAQVFSATWANALLGLLVGEIIGMFIILFNKYYRSTNN